MANKTIYSISTKITLNKMKNGGTITMLHTSMITRISHYYKDGNSRWADFDFFIKSSGTITRISLTSWKIVYNQAPIKQGLFQRYPYVDYPSDLHFYQPDYVDLNPVQTITGTGTITLLA